MRIEALHRPVDPLTLAAHAGELAAVVRMQGWTIVVDRPVAEAADLDTLEHLADRCAWRERPARSDLPFACGLVGTLTDALSPAFLRLPPDERPRHVDVPPLWFGLRDSAVCIAPDGAAHVVAADVPGLSQTTPDERIARWRDRIDAGGQQADDTQVPGHAPATPGLTEDEHAARVRQAQEWIAAGDLYQLNLTMQIAVPWNEGGLALTRRLWTASPDAEHAAWLALPGGVEVVSVSPETFLQTHGAQVQMRPIKGTRPRRDGVAADREQSAELRASAKDAAEHVMIVDLVRNDLGRVCDTGTVRVPELAALEAHPTVWHLTSTVTGVLRHDVGLAELLKATFPCGSVTGAPKRMAWQRIAALEPVQRGVYCGAVGTITAGTIDLSVAIRTAVVHSGIASYGTGGGIVADSSAASEHAEAMDKARAFLDATRAQMVTSDTEVSHKG